LIDTSPKLAKGGSSEYISGVMSREEELIIILDSKKFITDEPHDMAAGF